MAKISSICFFPIVKIGLLNVGQAFDYPSLRNSLTLMAGPSLYDIKLNTCTGLDLPFSSDAEVI
jgi:hypothetical protein